MPFSCYRSLDGQFSSVVDIIVVRILVGCEVDC